MCRCKGPDPVGSLGGENPGGTRFGHYTLWLHHCSENGIRSLIASISIAIAQQSVSVHFFRVVCNFLNCRSCAMLSNARAKSLSQSGALFAWSGCCCRYCIEQRDDATPSSCSTTRPRHHLNRRDSLNTQKGRGSEVSETLPP